MLNRYRFQGRIKYHEKLTLIRGRSDKNNVNSGRIPRCHSFVDSFPFGKTYGMICAVVFRNSRQEHDTNIFHNTRRYTLNP